MSAVDHSGHRDRLRNKYLENGLESLEQHEILEMLLFYAIPRRNTNDIAHSLINNFGSLAAVLDAPYEALVQNGLSGASATFIKVLPDLCRIYYDCRYNSKNKIIDVNNVIDVMRQKFIGRTEEHVILLLTDAKFREKYTGVISKGNFNTVDINISKIISLCTAHNAVFAIIAHNHPSGNAMPSKNDLKVTKNLYNALKCINVKLIDHVIIADNDALSFVESGIMDDITDNDLS